MQMQYKYDMMFTFLLAEFWVDRSGCAVDLNNS